MTETDRFPTPPPEGWQGAPQLTEPEPDPARGAWPSSGAAMSSPPPPPAAPPPAPRGPRRWLGVILAGAIVVSLLLGAALGGIAAVVVLRGHNGSSSTPAASSAPTGQSAPAAPVTQSGTPAAGPQETAIQQLIARADAEQAQALAARDPSVMADTATSAYYQGLVQTNQDLASQGVTAIQLVGLDWGPITVNGTSATATVTETWRITLADGTTDQSRDLNVYTLTQDNGAWKIQADNHPDSGQNPSGGSTPGGTPSPSPASPSLSGQDVSSNWSGYAANSGTYTAVSATWTVPPPAATGSVGVDATWVGIGGVNSRDLIQAGTQATVLSSGRAQYQAWIETLPQASQTVSLAVHPGDSVTVSLAEQQSGVWLISFRDNTTGQSYQQTVRYSSSRSSAEWVEEAPSGGRRILPLDNFGSVTFTNGSAVKNGQTVTLAQAGAQPITMIGAGRQALAVPSALADNGTSFTVTRTNVATNGQGGGSFAFSGGRRSAP